RRVIRPLQSFLETEVASGLLLLLALAVALVWANSPLRGAYEDLWSRHLVVRLGRWGVEDDLRGWIRDGLMTLFFLVAGLEVKRELLTGELRSRRAAILPAAAALGGMVVAALLYLVANPSPPASHGWGAAMPTDIALALGVLSLAFPRAPSSLRVFVLSLAIADDLGTIAAVAIFYSHRLSAGSVALALAIGAVVFVARRIDVRSSVVYGALGVAMGLLTPAVPFHRPRAVSREAHRIADETVDDPSPPDADAAQWLELSRLCRGAVSPLARLEAALHPWTSYVVLPVFVLADAG